MKCTNEKWKLTKILSFRFEERSQRRGLRNDGDGNENVKTVIGLLIKTTSLHTHPLRFLRTFLCRYFTITTRKCLISRFMEDVNKRRRNFLSLSKLECGSQEINSRGGNLFTAKWNKRDRVWKNANLSEKWRFRRFLRSRSCPFHKRSLPFLRHCCHWEFLWKRKKLATLDQTKPRTRTPSYPNLSPLKLNYHTDPPKFQKR